jgi:uncharacterized membrane protein
MTTGTTVARSQEARSYLDRVGAALADLPEEERADLLDELGTHVDEIAAEDTSSLEARLGTPEAYAAELRAAAGLPPARAQGRVVARLRTRTQQWLARPVVVSVGEFLVALRPVWWVTRGWVAGAVLAHLTTSSPWDYSLLPVPGGTLGFWGTLVAIVVSVQSGRGRIHPPNGRWRHTVTALNVMLAIALLPVLSSLSDASQYSVYLGTRRVEVPPAEGVYSSGTQVWNIYAYDAAGRMLHDVRLYDQDGNPLSLGLAFDPSKQQTLDATGQKVDNAFPYRYIDPTTGEVADPEAAPAIAAPPLLGVPTDSPAPTASATPSPSPTGGKR